MLFKIIDYFFGIESQNHHIVKNIQNINTLFISGFTAITTIGYFAFSSHYLLPYTLKLIFYHCSIDLLFTDKLDLVIHHIISISLINCFFYRSLPLHEVHFETLVLCLTELSSIFLVFREWLEKNSFYYELNKYAFVISFFYTRIYLLPRYLLFDEKCLNFLLSFMDHYEIFWYFGTLYAFISLNIYWGVVIVKSISSKLRTKYPYFFTYTNNEFALQFTYYLSPIISIYVYSSITYYQWLDLIGQCILSYNSCLYHFTLYNSIRTIENKKSDDVHSINLLNPNILPYYIADILSIHIRTFLCIATKLTTIYPLGFIILCLSLLHELISIYHFYNYTFKMIKEKIPCNYATKDNLFDHLIRLPILISIILSMIFSTSLVYANHNFISLILITFVLFVKPAYELNHLLLHFCLLYQTYALCLCNI